MSAPKYKRILLKLSGEALMGDGDYGIDPAVIRKMAQDIHNISEQGIEIAVVIGGGNIFRGAGLAAGGMDRVTGDHMGMLATVINALALQDALERFGAHARVMSALRINQVCEDFVRRRAIRHLQKGRVVVFAAGTGNPFFTTDSAAALRAVEMGADIMIKATKVDGVYDADPMKDPNAKRYVELSYDAVLEQRLGVMDQTAIVLCRDHKMPLMVCNIHAEGSLDRLIAGDSSVGTVVSA